MFPLDLRRLDFRHPYGVVIPQARVEALLEEHAKELGAEVRRGHEVVALQQGAKDVTAEVRTKSERCQMGAQYLVGCDGGHSVVRKQLGVAFPGLEPTVVGRMGDIKMTEEALGLLKQAVPALAGREFGIARTKTGNFAIVPLGSAIYRVAAIEWDQSAMDHDAPMDLNELREAIRRVRWRARATMSPRCGSCLGGC
jgi:2-polyprenyl-6-methoxyphenol hydroxylase-like FAD-dependent oxidoreductase